MAQTSEASHRIKIVIGLFIFLTLMYTFQGVILIAENEYVSPEEYNISGIITEEGEIPDYQNYTEEADVHGGEGIDPLSMIAGFFKFAFLQSFPDMPIWASAILGMVVTVILIINFYLIYQFIRDWIPFV